MDVENKDGALQTADKEIQQRDEELFDSLRRSKKERRKKRIRRIAIVVGVLAAVLIAAVLILRRQVRVNFAMDEGEVLSATVERGTISTVVSGSGMLENVDTETVTLPEGVEVTEILAQFGESCREDELLATVDMASVRSAMSTLQSELDALDDEISQAEGDTVSSYISAGVAGRVKAIYAGEGSGVADVMLDKGALAVLSLDGLMAVETETDSSLKAGEKVLVSFPDGSQVEGSVKSNVEGILTVTVEDDDYEPGTEASLATEAGESLGSGELYINSPWKVTAYTGDVSYVYIQEGQQVYEGQSLFGLENTGHSAEYQLLVDEHRDYEELMQELFSLYESWTVTAPCDGIVTGVDEEGSYMLLSSESSSGGLVASSLVSRSFTSGSSGGIVLLSAVEGEGDTQHIEDNTQPIAGDAQLLGGVEGEGGGTEPEPEGEPEPDGESEPGGGTGGQISITTTSLPGATVGRSYSAQLSASDGTGAVSGSWSVLGLPEGLSLDASASISLGTSGQVLCVPVAALGKEGGQDLVYTGCDEDSGNLTEPVAVTTGVSDGEYVQLFSGLEKGREVYYAWYDGGSSSGMPDMEPPFER